MLSLSESILIDRFGIAAELTQQALAIIIKEIDEEALCYQEWVTEFSSAHWAKLSPKQMKADWPSLETGNPFHILYASHIYCALLYRQLVIKLLVDEQQEALNASRLLTWKKLPFIRHISLKKYQKLSGQINQALADLSLDDRVYDLAGLLYQNLFPANIRHAFGEIYTPEWLIDYTSLRAGFQVADRVLDPTCGSGVFLSFCVLKKLEANLDTDSILAQCVGIDKNPLAILACQLNLLFTLKERLADFTARSRFAIYQADTLLEPLGSIGKFDLIIGNPPWINWETLSQDYRERSKALWEAYGFFVHSGMDQILGKGKKELASLLTYVCIDRYLADEGRLTFILPQSVLKSSGASRGFRSLSLPGGKKLRVLSIDDLSALRPFGKVATQAMIIVLAYGDSDMPIPSRYWRGKRRSQQIKMTLSLTEVEAETQQFDIVTQAMDAEDLSSVWFSGEPAALASLDKVKGVSGYQAHAGAYTGGANGVYWLRILGSEGEDCLRVENLAEVGKRKVQQIETLIEADLVYPLLRGRDLKRWQAEAGGHILMVQDPQKRRGYDPEWLAEHYPLSWQYLARFEAVLRQRAAYKRYFKAHEAFYSMFNIAAYTFAPYKAVWSGFGAKRMEAAVIGQKEGKAIIPNQAMHPFIACEDEKEAYYIVAVLNSLIFEYYVLAQAQIGGKSFAQPGILARIRLPKYDANDPIHQQLSLLSQQAHSDAEARTLIECEINQLSGSLWDLNQDEMKAIERSMDLLYL